MSGEAQKYEDPRTGGREVRQPKEPKEYVVRLIQHGGRVHLGIPRGLTKLLSWQRGELVLVSIEGRDLKLARLREVGRKKGERDI